MYQPTTEQSKDTLKEAIREAIKAKSLFFLKTSLSLASNHDITVKTLLDDNGNTCLHLAAAIGATEIAEYLLDNNADMAAPNRLGQTAEAIAASNGQTNFANWLKGLRKEKQRGNYANKQTVEKMQVALEELRSENRQLLQNVRNLKQEIDELKKTDHQPFLMKLQERLDAQESLMAQQRQVVQEQFVAQEKLMAQEKLKAQEQLEMQGKQLALQAEAIKEQQIEIKRQQNEIKNLQESPAREKKEEAKRQQEIKYQELREKKRQEEQKRDQLPKQKALIAALLKGDLEEAKKQEAQGALLTEPDEKGMYPLVAAVYGMDLEVVKYIAGKLTAEQAQEQWLKVDAQKAIRELDCAMPTALRDGATYGELGQWYGMNGQKAWCGAYDRKIIREGNYVKWQDQSWELRANMMIISPLKEQCIKNAVNDNKNNSKLLAPSRKVHDNVVKKIRGELQALRNMVGDKACKQPGAAFKPV